MSAQSNSSQRKRKGDGNEERKAKKSRTDWGAGMRLQNDEGISDIARHGQGKVGKAADGAPKETGDAEQRAEVVVDRSPSEGLPGVSRGDIVAQGVNANGVDVGLPEASKSSDRDKSLKKRKRRRPEVLSDSGPVATTEEPAAIKSKGLVAPTMMTPTTTTSSQVTKTLEKNKGGRKTSKKQLLWRLSDPAGGRMIDADPVFALNEKYLLLATDRALNIYSLTTSLLTQSIPINHPISSFALSSLNESRVYISTFSGQIYLFHWMDGTRIGRWDIEGRILSIAVSAQVGDSVDTVYTIDQGPSKSKVSLSAHRLHNGTDALKTELAPLIRQATAIRSVKVLLDGALIVAACDNSFFLGYLEKAGSGPLEEKQFMWREIPCKHNIACMDAHVTAMGSSKGQSRINLKALMQARVNIALGTTNGNVFAYEDLLAKLLASEKPSQPGQGKSMLNPRDLHWHREAVGSVKWSQDGNYIISGGKETVLVLWQLQTGKRQFLPHLTSIIDSIVVSPSGSSYAVRLADNSVIVLSTTELKPTAYIAGIQSQALLSGFSKQPQVRSSISSEAKRPNQLQADVRVPCAIAANRPNQLYLAVPSAQPQIDPILSQLSRPYLQRFDISAACHISRQALTRTNATTVNIGPEGNRIHEPNVSLIQVSDSGQWLATIDEWAPDQKDTSYLATNDEDAEEQRSTRLEMYLKFWSWNAEHEDWELHTRIDGPHRPPNSVVPSRVLDLANRPHSNDFATAGDDYFVRIWKPRLRKTVHRGTVTTTTWTCQHEIALDVGLGHLRDCGSKDYMNTASLAYSPDGSVFAASFCPSSSSPVSPPVHIIDAFTGTIRFSRTDLYTAPLTALGMLDRHLVVLSANSLAVWDIVSDELTFGFTLSIPDTLTPWEMSRYSYLAVNQAGNTFAVSHPIKNRHGPLDTVAEPKKVGQLSSQVMVWSLNCAVPQFSSTLPRVLSAMMPAQGDGAKGYVLLDCSAGVRLLNPTGARGITILGPQVLEQQRITEKDADEPADEELSLERDSVRGHLTITPSNTDPMDLDIDTTDKPVVRPQQLAELFDAPGHMGIPVKDMFNAIVSLYAGKPIPVR